MQCTAKYPAPLESINLRAMTTLRARFGVLVGLSDHSREPLAAPMAAVALGASVIEKHFTLSSGLRGPDHAYALDPTELSAMIREIRNVESTLGSGTKEPHPVEDELRKFARRSVFATRHIAAGEVFSTANVAVLRCGKQPAGLDPAAFMDLLGRTVAQDVENGRSVNEQAVGDLTLVNVSTRLRRLHADDTDIVLRWRNASDVARQMFSFPPTREQHIEWFETYSQQSDRIEFVILERDRPVGTVGLSRIDLGSRDAEFGILIGEPEFRGKGVATRASRVVLDFAFSVLGLRRVHLRMYEDNEAAGRMYHRLGFRKAEVVTIRQDDASRRIVVMTLSSEQWKTTS